MRVTLWGTRGSLASPGPDTARYGGNTACVAVHGRDGTVMVLDAGTGVRRLGSTLASLDRVHLLLSHLHMDHVQGLGFFAPLYLPGVEVHVWGPASTTLRLRTRLGRYLSPPLFPVRLRDLPCHLILHEVPRADFEVGEFRVSSALICHPGPTVGFRLTSPDGVLAYLSDHEPALGLRRFPVSGAWTSGHALAEGADLLIHDGQYTDAEYAERIGWGHSALSQTLAFAGQAGVRMLVPFHHDPSHTDADLDRLFAQAAEATSAFPVVGAREGTTFVLENGLVTCP